MKIGRFLVAGVEKYKREIRTGMRIDPNTVATISNLTMNQ
jgi:hypothetical protein